MSTYIKPMTPTRRAEIDKGFESTIVRKRVQKDLQCDPELSEP